MPTFFSDSLRSVESGVLTSVVDSVRNNDDDDGDVRRAGRIGVAFELSVSAIVCSWVGVETVLVSKR